MSRKNKRRKTKYREITWLIPRRNTVAAVPPAGKSRAFFPENNRIPRRGDIWFADLGSHGGTSVQDGCRPVMIVSNDIGNAHSETVNVLPMTRRMKKLGLPCHTVVSPDSVSDLRRFLETSMVLAEQITTIDMNQVRNYIGHIQDETQLNAINHAVSVQLGLTPAGGPTVPGDQDPTVPGDQCPTVSGDQDPTVPGDKGLTAPGNRYFSERSTIT